MGFTIDVSQGLKRRKRPRPMAHVDNGWPHLASKPPHFCICLEICCQSEDEGCICKNCPCQLGIPHGSAVPIQEEISQALEKECAKRDNTLGTKAGA
jgi:hypothetical protein